MKKIFLTVAVIASASMAFVSCKKDDNSDNGNYTSLNAVLANAGPQTKTFVVDAATGGTFYGNKYVFVFPPSVFRTPTGGVVTGNVTVSVLEVLRKSEMLFARMLPVSNGNQLRSSGELKITASQNGQELRLQQGNPIEIRIPQGGIDGNGMEFFRAPR